MEKPPGTVRIACLGDSTTFGAYIEEPIAYPRVLETMLNDRDPDRRYEVINAGTVGHDSRRGLYVFEHRVKQLSPDIVTFYYGVNGDHKEPEKYVEFTSKVIDECRENGIKIAIFTFPVKKLSKVEKINPEIRKLAELKQVPLLDLERYFMLRADWEHFFFDGVHAGREGSLETAELIHGFLVELGWVETEASPVEAGWKKLIYRLPSDAGQVE